MGLAENTAALGGLIGADIKQLRAAVLPMPTPAWHGLCAWTDDPAIGTATSKPISGETKIGYARAVAARLSGAALTLTCEVTTAGSGLTYARAAVYRLAGGVWDQVALTADQTTAWTSVGIKNMSVTLTGAISAGDELYFALLPVGTNTPTFRQAPPTPLVNVGAKRRALRTGQTALPSPLDLGNYTATNGMTWLSLG